VLNEIRKDLAQSRALINLIIKLKCASYLLPNINMKIRKRPQTRPAGSKRNYVLRESPKKYE
jgi:hypothetical protein